MQERAKRVDNGKLFLTCGGCDGVCSEESGPLPQQATKAHRIAAIGMKRNETLTLELSSSKSCSEDAALF